MPLTVTLTGYLGKDPLRRATRPRTSTRIITRKERFVFELGRRRITDEHDVLEYQDEITFTTTPRDYTVLSVASHHGRGRRRFTHWHRIIAWNTDWSHRLLHLLAKGDQVEITGRPTSFEATDGNLIHQLELLDLQILRRKTRPPQVA